ncbi:hypothetical protein CsSME_00006162 [Camellia sinensis var. sinensis]
MKLLGLLGNLKGITSDLVASECVLKLLNEGQIEFINKSEPQQLTQFAAHFISNTDQAQSCNFATFLPMEEDTPLQIINPISAIYLCTPILLTPIEQSGSSI